MPDAGELASHSDGGLLGADPLGVYGGDKPGQWSGGAVLTRAA